MVPALRLLGEIAVACDANDVIVKAAERRLGGGGGGPSIFELEYYYVDTIDFWIAFVGMIAFCVLVDRAQALLDHCAEGSPTNERFLQKVYSELLMFGVVAVTLFMVMQIWPDINPKAMTTITFIDVLCSMGACGLIGCAGVLSAVRAVYWKHWLSCEQVDIQKKLDPQQSKSTLVEAEHVFEHAWAHAFCVTKPWMYTAMSKSFKEKHKTPDRFNYHVYLAEVLTREMCSLMSINWTSWMMLFSGGCLAILFELIYTDPPSLDAYIVAVICLNWSLLIGHLILLVVVRRAFSKMVICLSKGDDSNAVVGTKWGQRTGWALQVIHLFNSFFLAFYLMHGKYNLRCKTKALDLAMIVPLVVNLLILLPLTLPQVVLVDGFFLLDASALDNVLAEREQADEDLRYMLQRWSERGCPDFGMGNSGGVTLAGFVSLMPLVGMNASPVRIKRIFNILDSDNSGTVEVNELLQRLRTLKGDEERFVKNLCEQKQGSVGSIEDLVSPAEAQIQPCTPKDNSADPKNLVAMQAMDGGSEGQIEQKTTQTSIVLVEPDGPWGSV